MLCTQEWMLSSSLLSDPCISACDPGDCDRRVSPVIGDVGSESGEDSTV